MATAKMVLDTRRIKNDGTYPVKVRITHDRKMVYYPTIYFFNEKEFEKINSEFRLSIDQKDIKTKLAAQEKKANDIIEELQFFEFETFALRFTAKGNKADLLSLLKSKSERLKHEGKIANANLYQQAASLLERYNKFANKSEEINIGSVSPKWLKSFEQWALSLKKINKLEVEATEYSETTLGMYLIRVRAVFNDAIDDEVLKRNQYPFYRPDNKRGYMIPKGENNKRALSKAEIMLIYNYVPQSDTEQFAKDIFIFSYLAAGMNTIDILKLRWSDIKDNQFSFIRKKTEHKKRGRNKLVIALTDDLNGILNRQGSRKLHNDYVFNVIPANATEADLIKKVKSTIATINSTLKRIAKKVGLTENISTYFARHSYATNLMNNETPLAAIQKQLGHADLKTTQNYLGSFEQSKIAEYENDLLDKTQTA